MRCTAFNRVMRCNEWAWFVHFLRVYVVKIITLTTLESGGFHRFQELNGNVYNIMMEKHLWEACICNSFAE